MCVLLCQFELLMGLVILGVSGREDGTKPPGRSPVDHGTVLRLSVFRRLPFACLSSESSTSKILYFSSSIRLSTPNCADARRLCKPVNLLGALPMLGVSCCDFGMSLLL
jgi:hypothetical protein